MEQSQRVSVFHLYYILWKHILCFTYKFTYFKAVYLRICDQTLVYHNPTRAPYLFPSRVQTILLLFLMNIPTSGSKCAELKDRYSGQNSIITSILFRILQDTVDKIVLVNFIIHKIYHILCQLCYTGFLKRKVIYTEK